MTTPRALVASLIFTLANSPAYAQQSADAPPATTGAQLRQVTATLRLAPNGVSEPMDFIVPPDTRSITVVVEGDVEQLYALASLRTADGTEHVDIDVNAPQAAVMAEAYYKEQVGKMPGSFYQIIRLGTFTSVYPYAPGQSLSAGASRLRVVSNATKGEVKVTVLMPADDGGRTLHINLILASSQLPGTGRASFLPAAQAIFAEAGIQLVVDQVRILSGTRFSRITEWSEPQERPGSQLARLAVAGRKLVASDALNIYIVDSLPQNVYGLSLGAPGPPISSSYYYSVVVRQLESEDVMARIFAHEVSHFLGLQHLIAIGASGTRYLDPVPDTELGQYNLMERAGTRVTPAQQFVLSRSPLLQAR